MILVGWVYYLLIQMVYVPTMVVVGVASIKKEVRGKLIGKGENELTDTNSYNMYI